MRSYSAVFSSTVFSRMLNDDYSFIDAKINRYDRSKIVSGKITTYLDYIKFIYAELIKNYRNEYLYKNFFINDLLLNKYGVKDTVVINEFRVGNSIADTVLFNGTSKAFEIKTELDSNRRLKGQIADYAKVFDQCYIITDESMIDKYLIGNEFPGIIALRKQKESIKLLEVKKAKINKNIDPETLIRCIRTKEYKSIITAYYGELPKMNSFNMFEICLQLIKKIPSAELKKLFLNEIKKRKTNTSNLRFYEKELRQLALSMQLDKKKYQNLITKLNNPINL